MDNVHELYELLTDDQDVIDILNAYAIETIPSSEKERREMLAHIMGYLGPTKFISTLLTFAGNQARMCQDIFDFCEKMQMPISGQIQVKSKDIFLERSSLNTNWISGGKSSRNINTEQKANALANAISGFAERLKNGEFTNIISHEELNSFGESIQHDPIYSEIFRSESYDRREENVCTDVDMAMVNSFMEDFSALKFKFNNIQMPASILSAISDIESELNIVMNNMSSHKIVHCSKPNPAIVGILDEAQVLFKEIGQLAEEITEGIRVRKGMGQFMRTEFWKNRWRIYEIWLLISVLEVFESIGGEVELIGIENNVWNLRYGRAKQPVASGSFSPGKLNLYYQLFRESDGQADMPDIAVSDQNGNYIIVLDPKHGYSYNRSKVRDILIRYGTHMRAPMTAIVNYFPISNYGYENLGHDGQNWIIASDVAPGTLCSKRLFLNLADVLLSKGYFRDLEKEISYHAPKKRIPAKTSCLIYWAKEAREVDEPDGAWVVLEDGSTVPLKMSEDGFKEILFKYYKMYLFSWDEIPGKESARLIDYLKQKFSIDWITTGKVEKIDKGETIRIYTEKNDISLELNNEKTEVSLKIDNSSFDKYSRSIDNLIAKMENNKLNIYYKDNEFEPATYREIISESPSKRYKIINGPRSVRSREGVNLLLVKDETKKIDLPLIRYSGKLFYRVKWSPDETRFVFGVRPQDAMIARSEFGGARLLLVRVNDKHSVPISMPRQKPSEKFGWVPFDEIKEYI